MCNCIIIPYSSSVLQRVGKWLIAPALVTIECGDTEKGPHLVPRPIAPLPPRLTGLYGQYTSCTIFVSDIWWWLESSLLSSPL